jgi:tetratricopeptide (TPR) repeat protein
MNAKDAEDLKHTRDLVQEEQYSQAEELLEKHLSENCRDAEAQNELGLVYLLQHKFQDAMEAFSNAIDADPSTAAFYCNLGRVHKGLGGLRNAAMAYAKALELDPDTMVAYNNLGIVYAMRREWGKAAAMFRQGLELDRDNPVLYFNYGLTLEANGEIDQASEQYRSALRDKPGWTEALNALGMAQLKQGEHAAANRTFSQVLSVDPANVEALNNKGILLADQGRHKDALKKYRKALDLDPGYAKAALNLARALEDLGNFSGALEELEKLLSSGSEPSAKAEDVPWYTREARIHLAALYLKMERYPESLEQARAVLAQDPENIHALRIEGAVQGIQGNDGEAKNIFEKILTLGPMEDPGDTYKKFAIENAPSRYREELFPAMAAEEPAPDEPEPEDAVPVLADAFDEEEEELPITVVEADMLKLMRYLWSLIQSLPDADQKDFLTSEIRLEMKHIIDILEKRNGEGAQ